MFFGFRCSMPVSVFMFTWHFPCMLVCFCDQTSPYYKITIYTQLGPTLMTSFNLLFNIICPNKVLFWITGLGIQLIIYGGHNSIHNCLHRRQRRRSSPADSEVLSQTKDHSLHYIQIITFITSSLFWGSKSSKLHHSSFPRREWLESCSSFTNYCLIYTLKNNTISVMWKFNYLGNE